MVSLRSFACGDEDVPGPSLAFGPPTSRQLRAGRWTRPRRSVSGKSGRMGGMSRRAWAELRHLLRPGITGLTQMKAPYTGELEETRVKLTPRPRLFAARNPGDGRVDPRADVLGDRDTSWLALAEREDANTGLP